jgi:hypothetical protein
MPGSPLTWAATEWFVQLFETTKPWREFFNIENFCIPTDFPELRKRMTRNVEFFQRNYFFVFLGLIIFSM